MEFLSDDPTYLAGGLGLLGAAFLIATKVTQQGKFLVWGAVSFALALLVVGVERVWVTDNERIEETVYGLGRAVAASDAPGVLDRLTPDVRYVTGGHSLPSATTRAMIEQLVTSSKFDFLRVSHLETRAGGQSRRGQAEFRVLCSGSIQRSQNALNFGSTGSSWSLGLRETSPGVWKVNRISPVQLPGNQNVLPSAYLAFPPETNTAATLATQGPGPERRYRRGFGRRSAASDLDMPGPTPVRWEP
ncbi:MAG: hypothetical protein LC745_04425 [Planctomycetia bacterium]|nr:hypothetical protein [Planctomycetia bacterium]